jgi:N-acetylglucosaminyl-diphospho-decaprenol L-rhamnosyltransferase
LSDERPDLSVVVVTHNGRDMALASLRSARAANGPIDTEWFVVDSGSTDGTPDAVAADFSDTHLIRLANVGFAAANNAALEHVRGRYVLLLNPDVEIERGTLAQLVRELDARPEVGAASVVQRGTGGELLPSIRRFPSPGRQLGEAFMARSLSETERDPSQYEQERSADWLVGAFLAVRREALEEVGALDERFFLYAEETDWCYRMKAAGWDVRHLPTLAITHHCGGYERPELLAQLTLSKLLFARKHFGRLRSGAIRFGLAARHGLRLTLLAPAALVRERPRRRLSAERRALMVAVGLSGAPLRRPAPEPGAARASVCPACAQTAERAPLLVGRDRMLGEPGDFAVVRCEGCGLAYTDPQLGLEDFERFYPSERYPSFEPPDPARRILRSIDRARLDITVRFGPYREIVRSGPGRILDVGCGRGDLAAAFQRHGWDAYGVEPSAAATASAAAHGVKMHNGPLDDAPFEPASFDAIVMNHSLEHIPAPGKALERALELLRPGGLLAVSVPNFGSWQARRFGSDWYQLDVPRHLQHFERGTLAGLAERSGFEVVAVRTSSMRGGLQASLQYWLFGRSLIRGRGWRVLSWLSAPVVGGIDVFADGDCLNLVARRP